MTAQSIPAGLAGQIDTTEGYLAQDPANPSLLARMIDLCIEAGDAARANHYADAALALQPGDAYARYRKGHALLIGGQTEQAADIFADLLAQHDDATIAHSLARCRIALGDHSGAIDAIGAHAAMAELPAAIATLLVRCMHHSGRLEEAIALVQKHEQRLADSAEFLAAAALAHLDQGSAAEAARLSGLARATGRAPLEALVVDGTLLLEGSPADAVACFRQVLERKPDEGRSWSGLGMASVMQRDFVAAKQQLETALKYMPHHIGTMHMLAWCCLFGQDLAGAEAMFQRAFDEDRNFGESHGGLAVVAALRGEAAKANEFAERALRLDPACLSARYARMVLSGEAADPERFKAIAYKLLGRHTAPSGENLGQVVRRHTGG